MRRREGENFRKVISHITDTKRKSDSKRESLLEWNSVPRDYYLTTIVAVESKNIPFKSILPSMG